MPTIKQKRKQIKHPIRRRKWKHPHPLHLPYLPHRRHQLRVPVAHRPRRYCVCPCCDRNVRGRPTLSSPTRPIVAAFKFRNRRYAQMKERICVHRRSSVVLPECGMCSAHWNFRTDRASWNPTLGSDGAEHPVLLSLAAEPGMDIGAAHTLALRCSKCTCGALCLPHTMGDSAAAMHHQT